jgi:hypothetical protein
MILDAAQTVFGIIGFDREVFTEILGRKTIRNGCGG